MKQYVLDANAVTRCLKIGSASGGEQVQKLFLQAARNEVSLSRSVINMGEVLYVLIKRLGQQKALYHIETLQLGVKIVPADSHQTVQAATLKHRYNLAYADSFAAALALTSKATLVSADPSFEAIGKSLKWMRLPPFHPTAD